MLLMKLTFVCSFVCLFVCYHTPFLAFTCKTLTYSSVGTFSPCMSSNWNTKSPTKCPQAVQLHNFPLHAAVQAHSAVFRQASSEYRQFHYMNCKVCKQFVWFCILKFLQRMTFRHNTEVSHWCDSTRRQLGRLKSDIACKMLCWSQVPAWSF